MSQFMLKEATKLREGSEFHTLISNLYLDERDQCIANRKDWKEANKLVVFHYKMAMKFQKRYKRVLKTLDEHEGVN